MHSPSGTSSISFSENSITSTKSKVTDFDELSIDAFRGRISGIIAEAEIVFDFSEFFSVVSGSTFWTFLISAT